MDGIEELLYFHYLLPVAAVAVTALIAGGIVSFKRRGRRTVAGTIFLTGAAAICLVMIILLLGIRHENIEYWDEEEDYIETGMMIYWDDYGQDFRFDDEEWVWVRIDAEGPWDIEETWAVDDESHNWDKEHIRFNISEKPSLADRLAAFQDKDMVFEVESKSGKQMLFCKHGYFCKRDEADEVEAYYRNINHYHLIPASGSAREKIPSADALVELEKMKNGRFRTVDWPTDEYGIWKNAEFYHLTGISDDKLFELTADIVLRDDRYYLFEYGTAPTEDDILLMDSEDPDDPDDLDTVCPISEETAEKLIGYLHKNGDY